MAAQSHAASPNETHLKGTFVWVPFNQRPPSYHRPSSAQASLLGPLSSSLCCTLDKNPANSQKSGNGGSLVLLTKTRYARPGKPVTRCLNSDSGCLLDATPVLEVWTSGDWQRCPERPEYCAAVCSKLKHSILEGRYPHQINKDNENLKALETQKVSRLKRSLGWVFQWHGCL